MGEVEGTNKAGPSELVADKRLRLWTTLIVFLLLAGFGIPLWCSTTTVYRAPLPTERINDLSSSKVQLQVHLELLADRHHIEQGDRLKSGLQKLLKSGGHGTQLDVDYIVTVAEQPEWLHDASDEKLDLKDVIEKYTANASQPYSLSANVKLNYKIVLQHSSALATSSPYVWIGARQYLLVRHREQDMEKILPLIANVTNIVLVQRNQALAAFSSASSGTVDSKAGRKDDAKLMAVSSRAGYRLAFTLVNSDPDHVCVAWNIKDAVHRYMQPFLNQVAPLADFVVHSQVLHYASSDLVPSRHGDEYHLSYDQLSHMINPLESRLASQSSNLTTLHFIVYIPASEQSPLRILNQDGRVADNNSFLIHRWGSLLVHNVEATTKASVAGRHRRLSDDEMCDIMAIFTSQLKSLLGILKPASDELKDVSLSSSSVSITSWEWNSLLFSRTVENVARTRATLKALVQLLDDVANMVISDHIQEEVVRAVHLAEKCLEQLQQGYLADAYALSQRALVASEKAFFDPSMLSLLYFPEDSKYAIYVPLFIPMAVPVLASILQSARLFKQIRQLTSLQGSNTKTSEVRVKTD